MPANLPKEALAKYQKVLEAKTKEEKLKALQEYLSAIPKHKGTENVIAQVRHQIAKIKREIEREKEIKRRITSGPSFNVKKEGDLQYVLVGFTKSGKSTFLAKLTNAKVEYGERPFITTAPSAGTLNYKGVLIQLVDTPSLMEGNDDWNNVIFSLIRSSDGIIIFLDALSDPINQFLKIKEILRQHGILIGERKFALKIFKSPIKKPKIILRGEIIGATEDDLYKILLDYGIKDLVVEIQGKASLEEFEAALMSDVITKPTLVIINKVDSPKLALDYDFGGLPYLTVSCFLGLDKERIGEKIFESSGMIRVYTKEPNEDEPSSRPLVVNRGITVIEVAEMIHRDLAKNFRYARAWGRSVKYGGEKVGPKHVLEDGDIIEIRT